MLLLNIITIVIFIFFLYSLIVSLIPSWIISSLLISTDFMNSIYLPAFSDTIKPLSCTPVHHTELNETSGSISCPEIEEKQHSFPDGSLLQLLTALVNTSLQNKHYSLVYESYQLLQVRVSQVRRFCLFYCFINCLQDQPSSRSSAHHLWF